MWHEGLRRREVLTKARKQAIIDLLARGQPKTIIADIIGVGTTKLYAWLKEDRELEEAAERQQEDLYRLAIERMDAIAFDTSVKPSAETQLKALQRIIHSHEEKVRREAGEFSMDRATIVLMRISQILVDLPEARKRVLESFADAGDEEDLVGLGPGELPSSTIEGEFTGA